jgi:DNA repair exonuclease SbcCD nuclease subunit
MPSGSILFVGDVHLGRRPARVPSLAPSGPKVEDLSPRAALAAVVREARARRVDAVVFLGDVVDGEENYLEAYGPLARAVRELVDGGIAVSAVAGNHDVRALPRLADEIEAFRLIGRGGRWESALVARAGVPFARLVGWSFPRSRVEESPLADFPALEASALPTLGVLHADLDASGGAYAPVARRDLVAAGLDGWLLGHVHAPSWEALAQARPIGYLGSLSALDPTEQGVHGPWLLTFESGRAPALEQIALAPLAWRAVELDVSQLPAATPELEGAAVRALRQAAEREEPRLGAARAVGVRLRLIGRHARHRELAAAARRLHEQRAELRPEHGGRAWFVESVTDDTHAAHDLRALARLDDLPGHLARRVLALESQDESATAATEALVREARARLRELGSTRPWSALAAVDPGEADVRASLAQAARAALDELLEPAGNGA